MNALSPIPVPPVVSNPDPPRPLLVVRHPRRSGPLAWVAECCSLTLRFRRVPGAVVMQIEQVEQAVRRFEAPGDGPMEWAEVCRLAGIADATPG